ncbi:MAG TPA: hypothetical protein ACFYEK_04290 [Candidatus Wunengus sp. YC60]|uniref:hypothetical protein n=1 Tax=Candidatus Wunengus sp. YC60 TaxID=3367697 RepID=UPI0040253176
MSIEELRQRYVEAKKAVGNCTKAISDLQKKADDLQECLPEINREIELAEKLKFEALDSFALKGDRLTESELKKARVNYDEKLKTRAETNELIEATGRALKKKEAELVRLNAACDLLKRQCWQAVFDEIKSAIPSEVFESVRRLQVIGSQCGQTRQWILDSLFVNPASMEHQGLCAELVKKYQIE